MRTPILLLAGLLAMTVSVQPAQACSSNDIPGCLESLPPPPEVCDGNVGTCDDFLCDGGAQTCLDDFDDEVQRILDLVEEACGGTAVNCLGEVVDLVEQQCGGGLATCDEALLARVDAVQGLVDADRDFVPDEVEGQLCSRLVVEQAVNENAPYLGYCASWTDYDPPAATTYSDLAVAILTGLVHWAEDYAGDHDHDGVPDDREAVLCSVEDQSDPADGSCVDGDYSPPF